MHFIFINDIKSCSFFAKVHLRRILKLRVVSLVELFLGAFEVLRLQIEPTVTKCHSHVWTFTAHDTFLCLYLKIYILEVFILFIIPPSRTLFISVIICVVSRYRRWLHWFFLNSKYCLIAAYLTWGKTFAVVQFVAFLGLSLFKSTMCLFISISFYWTLYIAIFVIRDKLSFFNLWVLIFP